MTKATTQLLLEDIKENLNEALPAEINIDSVVLLPKLRPTNEQGKIIRFYYQHTPQELGLL